MKAALGFTAALSFVVSSLAATAAAAQVAELVRVQPSNGSSQDRFGLSVSFDGNRALAGAPDGDLNGGTGAAFIYERNVAGGWNAVATLLPSDGGPVDNFGFSVSLSGDRALVGAHGHGLEHSSGAAYVFERAPNGTWREVAKLVVCVPSPFCTTAISDALGMRVALDGDRAAVGSEDKAYVFERQANGSWPQMADLFVITPESNIKAVAIDGDRLVVGARSEGEAYVFERSSGGVWSEVATLTPSDGDAFGFGYDVALSGDRVLVGHRDDDDLGTNAGAAYLYERQGNGTWLEVVKLTASDGAARDLFGASVSLSGTFALVGATKDGFFSPGPGAAYVFRRQPNGAWMETAKLTASDGVDYDAFGSSVSLSQERAFVGAMRNTFFSQDPGAAYAFDLLPLSSDVHQLSVSAGGSQPLDLDAGHLHAGMPFQVLGTLAGTSPGILLGSGLVLPLNSDRYFRATLKHSPPGFVGLLNSVGHASASFALSAGSTPDLIGLAFHHAFVVASEPVLDAFPPPPLLVGDVVFVSNAFEASIGP